MADLDITGLDKPELLARLYNAANHIDMEGDQEVSPSYRMNIHEAAELLARQTSFDIVKERMIGVDLSGETIRTGLYDRDNGQGSCAAVVEEMTRFHARGGFVGGVTKRDPLTKSGDTPPRG